MRYIFGKVSKSEYSEKAILKHTIHTICIQYRHIPTKTKKNQLSFFLNLYRTRGGGGGGCGGVGGGVTSYIWHSTDVRAEWSPFSALPGI